MQRELALPQTFFYDQVTNRRPVADANSGSQSQISYQENLVNTASREELVLMLYDGVLKFIRRGVYAGQENDFSAMSYNLLRAQKIIHYLDISLDMAKGKEVAQNMTRLYDFISRCLSDSVLKKQVDLANQAEEIICTLRHAWHQSFILSDE